MAWDKTLPANGTKIRNYPTVLGDNFSAIEEGDDTLQHWQLNFIERDAIPSAPPTTPTRIDDTMIIYSKQVGSSETELFILDDRSPANDIQITEDGSLGSFSTSLKLDSFAFDSNITMNENNVITAWSYTQKNGSQSGSFGMTCSRISDATYEYTFTTNMANANYSVIAMSRNAGGTGNVEIMQEDESFARAVDKFRVVGVNQNNTKVSNGVIHSVMVVGGRA